MEVHPMWQVLNWVFTVLLLTLAVFSVAAARGSVPLNRWAGIRLPSLMRSQATWEAGHRAAIVPAFVAFAVALVAALVGLLGTSWVSVGVIFVFVAGLVWVGVAATRAAARV